MVDYHSFEWVKLVLSSNPSIFENSQHTNTTFVNVIPDAQSCQEFSALEKSLNTPLELFTFCNQFPGQNWFLIARSLYITSSPPILYVCTIMLLE